MILGHSLYKGLQDYQPLSSVTVIEPSELFVTRFCLDVNITQDSLLENEETFLVVFSSPDPSILVSNGAATVMIIDDDCKYLYTAFCPSLHVHVLVYLHIYSLFSDNVKR